MGFTNQHSFNSITSSSPTMATCPITPSSPTLNHKPLLSIAHLKVTGMTCSACVNSIESLVHDLHGFESVSVALLTEQCTIQFDPSIISHHTFVHTITDAGFDAELVSIEHEHTHDNTKDTLTIDLDIYGMTCTVCSSTIEREISALPGVVSISISLTTKKAKITVISGQIGVRDLITRIEELGFDALVPDSNLQTQVNSLKRVEEIVHWRNAFIFCLAFAVPNMLIAMLLPMFWPKLNDPTSKQQSAFPLDQIHLVPGLSLNHFLQLLLTIPVQFGFVGRKFYMSAYKSLLHKTATMDVLIVLGTSSAFFASIASLLYAIVSASHIHVTTFFDTCTMLLMFISLGKYLENNAKGKTSSALTKLISLNPSFATLLKMDPKVEHKVLSQESISPDLVQVGDILKVVPGDRIPADGQVIFGSTEVDESMITGEAIPVIKELGAMVLAGTVNGSGCIHIRACKVGRDTTLARIFTLVEQAQATKAPIQRWADKVAGAFVPVVIGLALMTFFTWLGLSLAVGHFPFYHAHMNGGNDSEESDLFMCLQICISVIVVACPCTLGLSVPTAVMVGTGVGAELGILIKSGESLEHVHKMDYVVLDKTGTLTQGKMTVMASDIFDESEQHDEPLGPSTGSLTELEFWSVVSATEQNSEHPLGAAIIKHANTIRQRTNTEDLDVSITGFQAIVGQGVKAVAKLSTSTSSFDVAIGTLAFMDRLNIPTSSAKAYALGITAPVANGIDVRARLQTHAMRGHSVVFVAIAGRLAGLIAVGDQLKPNANKVVNALQNEMGIEVFMVTGDNSVTARVLAQQAGIPLQNVYAEISPSGKAKFVRALQQGGKAKVAQIFPRLQAMDIVDGSKSSNVPKNKNSGLLSTFWSRIGSLFRKHPVPRVSQYNSLYDIERASDEMTLNISEDTLVMASPDMHMKSNKFTTSCRSLSPTMSEISSIEDIDMNNEDKKNVVAMVGDGINDSIALAASDIGIALGTGSEVAMEAADIVIINSSLLDLVTAVDLSRTIFRRIQINFFWAGFYNVIAIPLAMGIGIPFGFMLHPMAAGAAMMFSSISVVLSSLLLKRYKRSKWIRRASELEQADHGSSCDSDVVVVWDEDDVRSDSFLT